MRLRLLPPVEVANTAEQAAPIVEYLMNRGGTLAIDTETTGLNIMTDRVLFWSLATEDRRFCFHVDVLASFQPLFQRQDMSWYLANAKYDMHLLSNMGRMLAGDVMDIIVMDAMEDDTRAHGLKEQARNSYGAAWGDFKDLFLNAEFVRNQLGWDAGMARMFRGKSTGDKLLEVYNERPDLVEDYASCDAFFTYMRADDLKKSLGAEELATEMVPGMRSLWDYYRHLEMPFTKVLWRMEREGIPIDLDYINKIDGPMRDGIAAARKKISKTAGRNFNPNSTNELRDILFLSPGGFRLQPLKYTAGGSHSEPKASTDEKTLEILQDRLNPGEPALNFIDSVMAYRKLTKVHGTYVKKLKDKHGVRHGNGQYYVHCTFNQAGARTSRLSSSNPNMQNIPSRNDPFQVRGIFVAPEGEHLISDDYPQIEFRVAAVMANEERMMANIRKGWDIHSANAVNMYADAVYSAIQAARKKDKGELTVFDRSQLKFRAGAKALGLGTMYGEGRRKIAKTLGCSTDEAGDQIDQFFTAFPDLAAYIYEVHEYAHDNEFTYTMLGRKRRLNSINTSHNRGRVAAEERQAFNTAIQGSSAEMLKLAMLQIDAHPEFRELGGRMLLTVHDELVSRGPMENAQRIDQIKKECMADPYRWGPIQLDYPVPVDPDGAIAYRWCDAK